MPTEVPVPRCTKLVRDASSRAGEVPGWRSMWGRVVRVSVRVEKEGGHSGPHTDRGTFAHLPPTSARRPAKGVGCCQLLFPVPPRMCESMAVHTPSCGYARPKVANFLTYTAFGWPGCPWGAKLGFDLNWLRLLWLEPAFLGAGGGAQKQLWGECQACGAGWALGLALEPRIFSSSHRALGGYDTSCNPEGPLFCFFQHIFYLIS